MIAHIAEFIRYFDSIRRRTRQFISTVPADRLDWAPLPGEYTCGDLVRHLSAAEEMFVGAVPDSALGAPCPTLDGPPVKTWRLLMALVEHEVHHRSQLAMYLTLMSV